LLVPALKRIASALICVSMLYLRMSSGHAAPPTTPDQRLGLPPLPADARIAPNHAIVALGKRLFSDRRLSEDGKISCAECHIPESGFTDGRARSVGHAGAIGTRNAPSLLNVVYASSLFWDGRASDLESQALAPLTNPVEHALRTEDEILDKVRADTIYTREFERIFNLRSRQLDVHQVAAALAAYERTLLAGGSPFDRYQYAGDQNALTPAALRGLALFRGRAQCDTCHTIESSSALFTDMQFHMTPLGLPAQVNESLGKLTVEVVNAVRENRRRDMEMLLATDSQLAALGRFAVTLDPQDIGKFKTPSLRNVALTAPYMHDGSVPTLDEAVEVELYGRTLAQTIPITLTVTERHDLVEFLRGLTSPLGP